VEEIQALGGLLFAEAIIWAIFCLGHYAPEQPGQRRSKVPGWLRKLFGDFRKEGTLLTMFMTAQVMGYLIIAIALTAVIVSDFTKKHSVRLVILHFVLIFVVFGFVSEVVPRVLKRGR
jgi:hypothetical protein